MKKEKKFLDELEKRLEFVSKRDKTAIVLKYKNIIDEKKENKERIVDILKEIGNVEDVANKEIEEYRKTRNAEYKLNEFFSKFKKNKEDKPKKKKDKKKKQKNKKNIFGWIKTEKKDKKEKKNFFARFKKEKTLKEKIEDKIENITDKKEKKSFFDRFKKKKTFKEKIEDKIEEIQEEENEVVEVAEIVTEKKIFETKEERNKRIALKVIRIVITTILLFIWLWICVVFIASIFAFLDGVKLYGLVIALGGLVLLVLSIIVLINKTVLRIRISRKWSFILTIISIVIIASGIAIFLKQIYKIKVTSDVGEKYNMTKKNNSYNLPNDPDKKVFITFNSNYKTDYIIEYDNTLENKVNVEVKYFECYYDYFVKKDSNNIYISLGLDNRDRLSVYIDDLKEGKIYDNKELERYVVKISMNEKDKERVIIK